MTNPSYLKLYHYSSELNLATIDPSFFGKGITRGSEGGAKKTFFYAEPKPESCVASGNTRKYEIYVPLEWKPLIYDFAVDDKNVHAIAIERVTERFKIYNVPPSIRVVFWEKEHIIKELGYKGFTVDSSAFPSQVIMLFDTVNTNKPGAPYNAYHWEGSIAEGCNPPPPSLQTFPR